MAGRISFVILALIVSLTFIVLASYRPVNSQGTGNFNGFDLVDKTGNIRKPADYRDRYQVLAQCVRYAMN
jgi:hypothetical protein